MTDRIIRIKSSRPSYRRAGLDLGSDWREFDTSDLSVAQQRALLGDDVLTIQGREDDGAWSPLGREIREGLLAILDIDAEEGAGSVIADDTLAASIRDNAADLELLGIGLNIGQDLVIPTLIALIVEDRDAAASTYTLKAAIQDNREALDALGVDGNCPELVITVLIGVIDALKAEVARLTPELNTPPEQKPKAEGGDPAALPQGADSTAAASDGGAQTGADPHAVSGEGGQGGVGGETAPKPAPKGGKPAKSKAAD